MITRQREAGERTALRSSPPVRSNVVALDRARERFRPQPRQLALVDNLANAAVAVACCAGMSVLGSAWAMRNPNEDTR